MPEASGENTAATGAIEPNQDNDLDLLVLRDRHLAALAANPDLRQSLKSTELQALLVKIDSSRSRLEALAAARHNVPEFDAFCQQILSTLELTV